MSDLRQPKWTFLIFGSGCDLIFMQILSNRVKALSITNVVAPRRVKRENISFPVAVRHSKTPLLKLPNITLNGVFSNQSYDKKRYVQPCLYLLFHDPTEKRHVLFIILMSIIHSLIQMFSEFSNHQFLSIIHQFFLSLYFLYYFVAEFIISIVLLIYKTILRLLIDMIFAAARVSLVVPFRNIET